jgi:hypothetical protein
MSPTGIAIKFAKTISRPFSCGFGNPLHGHDSGVFRRIPFQKTTEFLDKKRQMVAQKLRLEIFYPNTLDTALPQANIYASRDRIAPLA